MPQPKIIVVAGLGNPLMTDEGIGLEVVRLLMSRSELPGFIELIELGSSLMNVVHALAGRQKAVLIDCAFMNQPAGTICRFTPDDVTSKRAKAPFSLHQAGLLEVLEISRKIGEYPEEVVIYGIQPERVTPGDCISPLLHGRLGDYAETISTELQIS